MAIFLGASGAGGGTITVDDNHIFVTTTERDNYFVANPGELTEGLYCVVSGQLYEYRSASWVDITAVIQGPAGVDGITSVNDDPYGISWDGDTSQAPSRNTLYDKIETIPDATDALISLHGIFDDIETLITINTDTTKFDVAAFDYYIDGVKYTFAGQTGVSSGFTPGDNFMIINVDATGLVLLSKDLFNTPTSLLSAIELGGLGTDDGTNISFVGQSHFDRDTLDRDTYRWAKFAKGTDYIGTAGAINASVTSLQLGISGGSIVDPEMKLETITGEANLSAKPYYHVAGVWDFQPIVTPLVVSATQYDNGTDLVNISNNKWVSHNILRSARTNVIYYVPSQGEFSTKADAIDAPVNLGGFEGQIGTDISPLAKIIVQQGASIIDTVIDVRNQATNVVSASTSTLQTTYDRSGQPSIKTTVSGGPVSFEGGTGDDSDNIIEGNNNSGSQTYSVRSDGKTTISRDKVGFSYASPHLSLNDLTTGNMRLAIGIDSDTDESHLQSYKAGVGAKNIILQNEGGNVAIGTTLTNSKLSVAGDIDLGGVDGRGLSLYKNNSGTEFVGVANVVEGGGSYGMTFSTSTDSIGVERVRVKGNGNVGLAGITNPQNRLSLAQADFLAWQDTGNNTRAKINVDVTTDDLCVYVGANPTTPRALFTNEGETILQRVNHGTVLYIKGGDGVGDVSQGAQIRMENTSPSAVNGKKNIRVTESGALEVLNSAYSSALFRLEDAGTFLLGTTAELPNATTDHKLQVAGYPLHNKGWRDLVSPFTNTSAGGSAPTLVTLANGVRLYRFGAGDSVHTSYHVDHDYAEGTNAYHHIHWFPETAMNAGDTVTWRVTYIVAKGHNQGESFTGTRTSFDIVYTSPVGGTVAGDHIVSEASDLQAYDLKEPDTVILAEIKMLSKTYTGNVIGIQADLHYQSDREVTIGKRPDFNVAD